MKQFKSIKTKLILGVLIPCLIIYIIAGIYLKLNTEEWLFKENVEHNQVMLRQTAQGIEASILSRSKDLINMIAKNEDVKNVEPNVRDYLNIDATEDEANIIENERKIIEFFQSIKETHEMIAFLSYGTENGSYIEYPAFHPTESYDPRKRGWYILSLTLQN